MIDSLSFLSCCLLKPKLTDILIRSFLISSEESLWKRVQHGVSQGSIGGAAVLPVLPAILHANRRKKAASEGPRLCLRSSMLAFSDYSIKEWLCVHTSEIKEFLLLKQGGTAH